MTQTVTSFMISRKEWLRGEASQVSKLLRSIDQKRCCVGIYARALGVYDDLIRDISWPSITPSMGEWCPLNTEAEWLNGTSEGLSRVNDDSRVQQEEREKQIAAIFANHGITVTFED